MKTINPKKIEAVEIAALDEVRAVSVLVSSLKKARSAAAKMSLARFEESIFEVDEAAQELARLDLKRTKLTVELSMFLGLAPESSLVCASKALGDQGKPLQGLAKKLSEELHGLAKENLILNVCAKHGAAVSGHLAALASSGFSYGPQGRVNSAQRLQGRMA